MLLQFKSVADVVDVVDVVEVVDVIGGGYFEKAFVVVFIYAGGSQRCQFATFDLATATTATTVVACF